MLGDRVYASGGVDAAAGLAETLGAMAFGVAGGQTNFPSDHELWCGPLSFRTKEGREAIQNADVVLAVGCAVFDDFFYQSGNFVPSDAKLIHIDMNSGEIGKKEPTDIGIWASPKHALLQLDEAVKTRMNHEAAESASTRRTQIAHDNRARTAAFQELAASGWDRTPIPPASFGRALGDAIPKNANIFNDSISSSAMVNAGIAHRMDLNVMGARGGAIGWGIGATMGMKLADPDNPTIGIVGDGSAMMTVQGFWTAVNYGIPVTYVICNNAQYRILKVNMNVYHELNDLPPPDVYNAMDFPTPFDFKAQAEAYGGVGIRVTQADDIKPAIETAVASGKPACVDVILDGSV